MSSLFFHRFSEPTGSVRRTNRVVSWCGLLLALSVFVNAQEVVPIEEVVETAPEEISWRMEDGKLFKNDVVFVESGLEAPLGFVPGKNGSVIVAQPAELTQIFDEDGDGKGDFFRALIGNLSAGNRVVSAPMVGSSGEIFVAVERGGQVVDLVGWRAEPLATRLVLSMPSSAGRMAIDANDNLAAVIRDDAGVWIGIASLAVPTPLEVPLEGEEAENGERKVVPVSVPVAPNLVPAVRVPNALIGEGNDIASLEFAVGGGFLVTVSDGRVLKVTSEIVKGRTQGSVFWYPGKASPFAIQDVRIMTDGFAISLTKPADRGVVLAEPLPFQILESALVGVEAMESIKIVQAAIEPDGMTLTLVPEAMQPERLYVFDLSALKSEAGDALAAEKTAYTVMEIPDSTVTPPLLEESISDATMKGADADSAESTEPEVEENGEKQGESADE